MLLEDCGLVHFASEVPALKSKENYELRAAEKVQTYRA
jgi:hypothetical protein